MLKKKLFACLLLCLSVVVSAHPSLAQEKGRSKDPVTQMQRDGWKIVQDGVLQRERGAGQVETFVFGAPFWVVCELAVTDAPLRGPSVIVWVVGAPATAAVE